MTDIGLMIRQKLEEKGKTKVWLAGQLPCSRANIYKILNRKSIDTGDLLRISRILGYDFFRLYSEDFAGRQGNGEK